MRVRLPGNEDHGAGQDSCRSGPRCFMHIPKSAGESIHTALNAALPNGSLAPQRFDKTVFCEFNDFDNLCPETRAEIAVTQDEVRTLAGYRVISGHFSLDTLTTVSDPSSVATILREPRARLLSLYMYWRIPDIYERWNPYRADKHAMQPLAEFLSDPYLGAVTDNQICRMLVPRDPRIPASGFVMPAHVSEIAASASARLEELGFVGFIERDDDAWNGLSRFFGVRLARIKVNVTGEGPVPVRASPSERLITASALDVLDERNAADQIVYRQALSKAGVDVPQCEKLADAAFAEQLDKLGDLLECSQFEAQV